MISIVVPSVRNSMVTDPLTAIIAQTDTDWELTISDQSKTNVLVSVLNDLADPRIRRVECPGHGAALARNFVW